MKVKITVRVQRVRGAESRTELQMVIMGHRGRGEHSEGRYYPATLQAGVTAPGICWYPAKRTAPAVNQGGTVV